MTNETLSKIEKIKNEINDLDLEELDLLCCMFESVDEDSRVATAMGSLFARIV